MSKNNDNQRPKNDCEQNPQFGLDRDRGAKKKLLQS